jgi:hypothetical protein
VQRALTQPIRIDDALIDNAFIAIDKRAPFRIALPHHYAVASRQRAI